jgi:hypothetical protein
MPPSGVRADLIGLREPALVQQPPHRNLHLIPARILHFRKRSRAGRIRDAHDVSSWTQ